MLSKKTDKLLKYLSKYVSCKMYSVHRKIIFIGALWYIHPLLDTIVTSFVSKPANLDIGT